MFHVLARQFPVEQHPNRVFEYKKYDHIFDEALKGIEFSIKAKNNEKYVNNVNDFNLIEGGLIINVYHHDVNYKIELLYYKK